MGGVVKLCRQFDASGASADDGHADLLDHVGLPGVGAQIMIEQLLMEALGLFACIEEQAMLRRALGAEIVGGAAHADHQRVISHFTRRHQLDAVFVIGRGQLDFFCARSSPLMRPSWNSKWFHFAWAT